MQAMSTKPRKLSAVLSSRDASRRLFLSLLQHQPLSGDRWRFFASNCAGRIVVGVDDDAIDQLQFVWRNPRVVQRVQNVLPQPGERPAPELAIDRRPLAEYFGQVPPGRTDPRDPENSIQNKVMVGGLLAVAGGADKDWDSAALVGSEFKERISAVAGWHALGVITVTMAFPVTRSGAGRFWGEL